MVLKVPSDMRRVVNGPNSDALQVTGVTHAAELQDLG